MPSISINTYNGYISKSVDTSGSNPIHISGIVTLTVEGDGNYKSYGGQIDDSFSLSLPNVSSMSSGFYPCFKFDPHIKDSSSRPVDVYDSTNQYNCSYFAGGNPNVFTTGSYGTMNGVTFTSGAGGYLSNSSTTSGRYCYWPAATKTGTSHLSTTSGRRTICLWVKTSVASPTAFQYIFADNSQTSNSNYSGVIIQYPSNRSNAITWLAGDGAGTGSGDRRSFLGITDTMSNNAWNFVVIGVYGGTGVSGTTNYTNITAQSASARNTTNNGASGTSGSYTGNPSYNSSYYPITHSSSNASQSFVGDIGYIWVFPFYMASNDTRLDDIFANTKELYS
jgi:hypothetical protein